METLDATLIARKVFDRIAARFPDLRMVENPDDPVELSITLPTQTGLKQKIWLALQGDELHFSTGHFWCEWFPCTDEKKVEVYVAAVCGFISGDYRILEHCRGAKCVKAELQKPVGEGWQTVGTWGRFLLPWPRKISFRDLRNA